jgi:hypothetical protein
MDIRQLPGGVGEKEEYKHVHIKSGHLLKIRVMDAKSRGDCKVALFGIVYTFIGARVQTESGDLGSELVGQM